MKTASDFIRDDIKSMSAYRIADLPEGFIKLDAMESPYHPFARFPELSNEWLRLIAQAPIHLYPNPAASGLQETLRKAFDIPESATIALGNGSDELIQFMTLLVAQSGATMLAVEPSFVMYRHNAELYGMNYVGVPLNEDFTLDLPAVLSAIEKHQPALISSPIRTIRQAYVSAAKKSKPLSARRRVSWLSMKHTVNSAATVFCRRQAALKIWS